MKMKYLAMTSGGALLGAALVISAGIRAEDSPAVEAPQTWQVAANTTGDEQQPTISMDEISRRLEQQYNGKVTEIERDREHGRDVYEVELSTADGHEWDIDADAVTGEILNEERERDD